MDTTTNSIVSKVWSFCNTLRDDGVSYGDYLEQLTYLLFLKMADEYSKPPHNRALPIPPQYAWESLTTKRGAELETHYTTVLRELGHQKGILGQIFTKSQNKIQDPAKLYKLVDLIGKEQWSILGADVKGQIYEGLLEKNAEDTKSGAGQYFTPRALIRAMVECVRPEPAKTVADPACGAGETVRKRLLETADLHTILRLPTGIFYAHGVKANVIFFDAKPAAKESWTKEVWYYDYRTNIHHTLKKNPLRLSDLREFIECYQPLNRRKRNETYHPETNTDGRWRKFTYEEIINRDKTSLDITWIKDKSLADLDNLPNPDELAEEIIENLEAGLESFKAILNEVILTR
jgi:type I restriction-modification system DNA methylase subunit